MPPHFKSTDVGSAYTVAVLVAVWLQRLRCSRAAGEKSGSVSSACCTRCWTIGRWSVRSRIRLRVSVCGHIPTMLLVGSLLGHQAGLPGVSPYAAPGRATDLVGLPAAYIWVGALDLFVDESIEYARRLLRAGVPTELRVYPGVMHGNILVPDARAASSVVQTL